jgi:hypothetical protein
VLAALGAAIPAALVSLPSHIALPGFLGEQMLRGAYLALQPMGVVLAGLLFYAAVSGAAGTQDQAPATARRVFIATLLLGTFMESVTGFAVGAVFALATLRGMGIIGAPAGAMALLDEAVDLAALAFDPGALQAQERPGLVLMQACSGGSADCPRVLGQSADYQLRFFAPGLGIPEDPVTGSAHALVAPWWLATLGRSQVVGWQPSSRRGGMLCESPAAGLVRLTGSGHLLWDGLVDAGGMPLARGDWSVCKGY